MMAIFHGLSGKWLALLVVIVPLVFLVQTTLGVSCSSTQVKKSIDVSDRAFGHKNLLRERYVRQHSQEVSADPNELYFTQRLDHFNGQDQRTWQQRYFVNDTYWKAGGPIFIMLGGEGAISGRYVYAYQMSVYASHYGALQFGLEHRFYGKSQPLADWNTDNLKYLSSQQALDDAATFINAMKTKWGAENSQVITFGGSYPGNLAAWFRMKYPHITLGSVASSAPVNAVLDFIQYLDVVDLSIAELTGVECDTQIRNATDTIEAMLKTAYGKKEIEQLYKICTPLQNDKDITTFMSTLMSNWMGEIQYYSSRESISLTKLCTMMENPAQDALHNYADVNSLFLDSYEQTCLDASYTSTLNLLDIVTPTEQANMRQWVYQTCIEFGYFQSTDSSEDLQPFGTLVPVSYYTDMCTDIFGFDFLPLIAETNEYYGATEPYGASNILFVNGDIDPWHALSINADFSSTVTAILIDGTAHCADFYPATPNDPPGLAAAQSAIDYQIGVWLRS